MSKFRIYQSPIIVSTFITVVVLVFLLTLNLVSNQLNFTFENTLANRTQKNNPNISKTVALVEIDDKTLADENKGGLGKWQDFKRSYYAKVLKNLHNDGAIVIGLDILLAGK